jgi:isoleucyl-tRNA synthetase
MSTALPEFPDTTAIELDVLGRWEAERTFEKLRERNRDGQVFSFIDGPITANKTLGVHTAWGRTLKDVFQRYKAMRGFKQRYQNGFDCQGLWIEVAVERELGLNSKREIEEYGLEEFARRCRSMVAWSAEELSRGSKRLGVWMDWGNDYFTLSDTNIEYVWHVLKVFNERDWLYRGYRAAEWCPRCGTSISQHELIGSYVDRADPSLFVRFPLLDRPDEAVVIWTTAPWTLPANVAVAVNPEAEYGRRANGEWVARSLFPSEAFEEIRRGRDLVGWRYRGPFDELAPAGAVEHRVIPWDEVWLEDGTGIVHIAPGCGRDDFELSRVHELPVLTPVDESGRFYSNYGWLHRLSTVDAADQIIGDLERKGILVAAWLHEHRFPECWRCHTPLITRIADDWYISVRDVRQLMLDANATVEWTPEYMGKRMDDWLRNMGDWNISRRRYYGTPLPFYPCACGHMNVIGSRAELEDRAVEGLDQLEELHRPWIDRVPVRCERCGEAVERVKEVGDVWLDAGIVPFSTLGWHNDRWIPQGYATGAAKGLTTADLPDHEYWQTWFPADWVSEMREQIRLWFYSQLLTSVLLTGRAPFKRVLGYEKMLDETGREMHGSWGTAITADEAFARMGADVMRWQYCAQPADRNLLFGFGPAEEIKRRLLIHWHSIRFFLRHADRANFTADPLSLDAPPLVEHPFDRWLLERTNRFVCEATAAYESTHFNRVINHFDLFAADLSRWYMRLMRRRLQTGDDAALRTLWYALVQSLRIIAPIVPFRAEHLWRHLVPGGPESVFLAGWPEEREADRELLDEMETVRRVVACGRRARGRHGIALRQPLRKAVVEGAPRAEAYRHDIAAALNVKEVQFAKLPEQDVRLKPNLPLLGPKFGRGLPEIQFALATGNCRRLKRGSVRVNGLTLDPEEVLVEHVGREGWSFAGDGFVTVALDIRLDDALHAEGELRKLIREVTRRRMAAGLGPEDPIHLCLPDERWLRSAEQIAEATHAISVRVGDSLGIEAVASSASRR